MLGGRQLADKRRKECEAILRLPVTAVFMNGNLPHGVGLAWTGKNTAYLVNFRKGRAQPYVRDGKFLMRRALLPVRVRLVKGPPKQLSFLDSAHGLTTLDCTEMT